MILRRSQTSGWLPGGGISLVCVFMLVGQEAGAGDETAVVSNTPTAATSVRILELETANKKLQQDLTITRSERDSAIQLRDDATAKLKNASARFCESSIIGPTALYCFDIAEGSTIPELVGPKGLRAIIPPNTTIEVAIRACQEQVGLEVTVPVSAGAGLFRAGSQPVAPAANVKASAVSDINEPRNADPCRRGVSHYLLGARQPGPAKISIAVTNRKDPKEKTTLPVNIDVEKTYASALRVGVAAVFGNAVDAEFAAEAIDGAKQAQISRTKGGSADLEVVLGFAPFLNKNGRGDVTSCYPACFAPYAGLGVVELKTSALRALTSLHIGAEWSMIPDASIAATLVFRRVTRLNGQVVGGPVATKPSTRETLGVGFGVVVNFSPEFIQFAKQAGEEVVGP